MANKLLYPKNTKTRQIVDLSGLWKFAFDFENCGDKNNYKDGIPAFTEVPVPSSFADFFTEKRYKEYAGDIWYETEFYADESWKNKDVDIRFFAAAHNAWVYLNGIALGAHKGGFLPFNFNLNDCLKYDDKNVLVVKINNELNHTTLPCGETVTRKNGEKFVRPYFDFFNYSGLIRPVKLVITPKVSILDITLNHTLDGDSSVTDFNLSLSCDKDGSPADLKAGISVYDEDKKLVFECAKDVEDSASVLGSIKLTNPHLWEPLKPYLYTFEFQIINKEDVILDSYFLDVGIRSVSIKGNRILVNDKPVYLKGFGKHEDSPVLGRGYNLAFAKRDFELMKWIGANSFRTSHYPYSEEIYQIADKEGFLVIDELPAVGMLVSARNAVDAATGAKVVPFFDEDIVQTETLKNHMNTLKECIDRDKNYACVIAWSILNEPDTIGSEKCVPYFRALFDAANELDVQKRPRSFAHIIASQPDQCLCTHLCDFVMLNRYYGWYLLSGIEMDEARERLDAELSKWDETKKPVMFTEYGTDNYQGLTRLPAIMWTENYQGEYLDAYHEIFDKHECIMGEQVWNFADFQTTEGMIRVDGNKKGIFTRNREPKMAAFKLKERWEKLPLRYKG